MDMKSKPGLHMEYFGILFAKYSPHAHNIAEGECVPLGMGRSLLGEASTDLCLGHGLGYNRGCGV